MTAALGFYCMSMSVFESRQMRNRIEAELSQPLPQGVTFLSN